MSKTRHRRRRRRHSRALAVRSNPPRRSHRRRRRRGYSVSHVIRRVRMNPSVMRSQTVTLLGGAVAMGIASEFIPQLVAKIMPANSTTTAKTKVFINDGIKLGIGVGAMMLLKRRNPSLGTGILIGSAVSVAMDLFAMAVPSVSTTTATTTAQQTTAGGTPGAGGTGGYAGTAAQGAGAGGGYAGTGAQGGTGGTGMAAYLGRAARRRRRLNGYLGRMNGRRMGAFLSPGAPIQSLIGAENPSRRAFGRVGSLNGMRMGGMFSTGGGPGAFPNDAWKR